MFLVDQRGLPLVARISGAQVHDSRLLIPLMDAIRAVPGLPGRARKRPVNYMRIARTRHGHIALGCAGEVSSHVSLGTVSSRVKGLAAGVGSLNAPLVGFTAFEDCAFATSAAPTFIKPSFLSHAR
jgi:hypothetical protein